MTVYRFRCFRERHHDSTSPPKNPRRNHRARNGGARDRNLWKRTKARRCRRLHAELHIWRAKTLGRVSPALAAGIHRATRGKMTNTIFGPIYSACLPGARAAARTANYNREPLRRGKQKMPTRGKGSAMNLPADYHAARQALVTLVRPVDEVKAIHDKSLALQVYAHQTKDVELGAWMTEIVRRALRRMGEIMAEMREAGKLAKGTRGQLKGKASSGGLKKNPPEKRRAFLRQARN